jgi:hypothetical protein
MNIPDWIALPWNERTRYSYPWRPMDNKEKLANWSLRYKWKYGNNPREDQEYHEDKPADTVSPQYSETIARN